MQGQIKVNRLGRREQKAELCPAKLYFGVEDPSCEKTCEGPPSELQTESDFAERREANPEMLCSLGLSRLIGSSMPIEPNTVPKFMKLKIEGGAFNHVRREG
ncbi:MAG TPA: hypothetical protein VFX86_01730 [Candidatus Saccharimonadales bacterium]|nr:hypothetical protein [Candidatus Saccharimonadales bacterium]